MTAQELASIARLHVYERSVVSEGGRTYALVRGDGGKQLCIASADGDRRFEGTSHEVSSNGGT
ncbi:MAG TPA: hypothetical protein VF190_00115, partial [Rhodothermales bacterium]